MKKKICIILSDVQMNKLLKIKAKSSLSISDLVRMAVDKFYMGGDADLKEIFL